MITEPRRLPEADAAHTMALVSAMAALVSLALPWMSEGSGSRDRQHWTGWMLFRPSLDDGRVAVPVAVVVVLVVGTVALVLAAWFWQDNQGWRGGPKVMPWIGGAYLAGGLFVLDLVTHDVPTRAPDQAAGGIVLWLVSVLLFTCAAGRLRSLRQ